MTDEKITRKQTENRNELTMRNNRTVAVTKPDGTVVTTNNNVKNGEGYGPSRRPR